jgi:DNA-binding transcriptional ArsR family regulator
VKPSDAVRAFSALAHETRLEVFRLLVRSKRGVPAGAVSEALSIPAATLSFHLKELRQAGIIDCRRESRSIIYYPAFDAMNRVLRFMTENCCTRAATTADVAVEPACDQPTGLPAPMTKTTKNRRTTNAATTRPQRQEHR